MKTSTILMIGGGAALLYLLGQTGAAQNALTDLQVNLTMPGMPSVSGGVIQVPVKIQVSNSHPINLPIDMLVVTAERETAPGVWSQMAYSKPDNQGFVIRARSTTEFSVVMQSTILNSLIDAFQVLTGGIPKRIRINVAPVVMGVRVTPISEVFDFSNMHPQKV